LTRAYFLIGFVRLVPDSPELTLGIVGFAGCLSGTDNLTPVAREKFIQAESSNVFVISIHDVENLLLLQ